MRRAILVLAALGVGSCAAASGPRPAPAEAAAAPAATARGVEDPVAFVRNVYEAYRAEPGGAPDDPVFAYSNRLRLLFDAYQAWAARHDDLVGPLDFDWWINAQDWELGPVEVGEEQSGQDRRIVVARFTNRPRRSQPLPLHPPAPPLVPRRRCQRRRPCERLGAVRAAARAVAMILPSFSRGGGPRRVAPW